LPTAVFHHEPPPSGAGAAGATGASGAACGGCAGAASGAGFFLKKLNMGDLVKAAVKARENSRYNGGLMAL